MAAIESIGGFAEAPSLIGSAFRVLVAIGAIVLAACGWLWWQRRSRGMRSHLQVLDRAFLARGSSVALLRVDERRLLVGVSADGVRLLRDLDAGHPDGRTKSFPALLDEAGAKQEGLG